MRSRLGFDYPSVGLRLIGSLCLLIGFVAFQLNAQTMPKEEKTKAPPTKIPSGSIIVVTDKVSDVLQKNDAIYLTSDKYKELLEQNEQLKKQIQASEKALPPSECRLDARLETRGNQTIVRVRATMRFKTTTPRSSVFLGFQNAQPFDPKLDDGKLPLLVKTDQGLTVLVENEGEHTLKLEMETPLASRGSKGTETGFELSLPGSPITLLTAGLPAKVKRLTLVRKEIGTPITETRNFTPDQLKPESDGLPLGALSSFELYWEDSDVAPRDQQRTAQAEVVVNVIDGEVQTETKLRLNGTAKEWKFVAPANAEIQVRKAPLLTDPLAKVTDLPFEQAPIIVRPEANQPPIWKLQFREANATDLLVVINSRQPRPQANNAKANNAFPIGPYAALDVSSQTGTIRFKTPPQLRIIPTLKGDTRRQDSGDDPLAEAVFRYTQLPPGANNLPGSPLEVELRTLPGVVQTNTTHQLQLVEKGWRLTTEIQVTPVRIDLDRVELELPSLADFLEPRFGPLTLIEGATPLREVAPNRRVIQLKLLTPQRGPFVLTVEGIYSFAPTATEATLNLPRLLHTDEKDSQVSVTHPEGQEVRGQVRIWLNDKIGTWPYPLKAEETRSVASLQRSLPAQVELTWKPEQPRFRVESLGDLLLMDGSHRMQQQLKFTFTGKVPRKLKLKLSDGNLLRTGVAVNSGTLEFLGGEVWLWSLPPLDVSSEVTLKTTFAFREEDWQKSSTLRVPLFWPEGALQSETRVRVWRDPASRISSIPANPSDNWSERPPEIVPEEKTLPMRVLSTIERYAPLALDWLPESEGGSLHLPVQAWADRLLMQVQMLDGSQRSRLRMPLRRWTGRQIEMELPVGVSEIEVFLGGKQVEWFESNGVLQIPLPLATEEPLMLEVRYQSPAPMSWFWKLSPPRFRGTVSCGAIRWQVALPPRIAPLCLSDGILFEERWAIRNGLPTAVAGRNTVELENWLNSGSELKTSASPYWDMSEGTLTFRQSELDSVRILAPPRLLWLIVISLGVLLLGLFLSRLNRGTGWLMAAGLGMLGLVLFFFWPQMIRQTIAASVPGIAVVLLFALLQRYLHYRYRWKLAHMPAFRRTLSESASPRPSSRRQVNPPKREPSTVDVPPS